MAIGLVYVSVVYIESVCGKVVRVGEKRMCHLSGKGMVGRPRCRRCHNIEHNVWNLGSDGT